MKESVNIHEAKSHLSSLISRAEAGEDIVIARANKPVVRLTPIRQPIQERVLGEAKGLVEIHADFDQLPEDFLAYFS